MNQRENTLRAVRYARNNRQRAEEHRLVLTAALVFREARTGKVIVERPEVQGEATFVIGGDLGSAKRGALPTAARDLAHDIVEAITEAW